MRISLRAMCCVCRYADVMVHRLLAAVLQLEALPETARDRSVLHRVGQNRIFTPYMTVYFLISLPRIPYIHRIYIWFWLTLVFHFKNARVFCSCHGAF
jgi:hypothetical protein